MLRQRRRRDASFYPRPPYGGRPRAPRTPLQRGGFYPRPPYGGRPRRRAAIRRSLCFYPRPPYGGRLSSQDIAACLRRFYPRPPYGGRPGKQLLEHVRHLFLSSPSIRRATRETDSRMGGQFLSSPSIRRATRRALMMKPSRACFYPRPPYGGRLSRRRTRRRAMIVSILALHTEGDDLRSEAALAILVSILALHTEGDHGRP